MEQGGGGIGYSSGGAVLVAVTSGGLLTVQSCLLKEIFGNNCIAVRGGGKNPYFLPILFRKFEMLAPVSRIDLDL